MLHWIAWLLRGLICFLVCAFASGSFAQSPPTADFGPERPREDNLFERAQSLMQRGDEQVRNGQTREALTSYKEAHALSPSARALRSIANLHFLLHHPVQEYRAHDELLRSYEHALTPAQAQHSRDRLAALAASLPTLTLVDVRPGTHISIDGQSYGQWPLSSPIRLVPGEHTLELSLPEHESRTVQFEQTRNGTELDGKLPPQVTTGKLTVRATTDAPPPYATLPITVFVDDKAIGRAPLETALPPGEYAVYAASSVARSTTYRVPIAVGHTQQLELKLELLSGTLTIRAVDKRAAIHIDEQLRGYGSWSGELAAGEHEARVEREGFEPFRQRFSLQPGEHLEVTNVQLARAFTPPLAPPSTQGEDEPSSPPPSRNEDDPYRGLYGYLTFLGMVGSGSTHEWSTDCPLTQCDVSVPIGGGLGLRVGYNFGVLGLEAFAIGALDYHSATMEIPEPATPVDPAVEVPTVDTGLPSQLTDELTMVRVGGSFGAALRASSRTSVVRFTGAAGLGITPRTVVSNVTLADGSTDSYVAPTLVLDGGVLFGDFLHVGVLGWFEFADTVPVSIVPTNVDPSRLVEPYRTLVMQQQSVDVYRGTQIFFGLFLGFHFGA